MEEYPAVYTDFYGREQTRIRLGPDGHFLTMTLRGVQFQGISFDVFYVWPPNQDQKLLKLFHLHKAYLCPEFEPDFNPSSNI